MGDVAERVDSICESFGVVGLDSCRKEGTSFFDSGRVELKERGRGARSRALDWFLLVGAVSFGHSDKETEDDKWSGIEGEGVAERKGWSRGLGDLDGKCRIGNGEGGDLFNEQRR